MNLQFIKYFVTLAEVGNFTAAASKVHVVQSSFSTGIKKLEQQLNCKLFYRDNRKVLLTDEGKQLLPMAKQLLRTWNDMERVFSEEYTQPLKLGVVSQIDFNAIVPMLKAFHELYPNIETQIIEKEELELHQLLKDEQINGYFQKFIPFDHSDFNYRLIRKDKLVFAIPSNHPLATKHKLPLHALEGQQFIERTNCSLYSQVEEHLEERNIRPNTVFRAKGDAKAKSLVSAGVGISLVPQIEKEAANIRYVPISDAQFERKIFLIWKKENPGKAMDRFLSK